VIDFEHPRLLDSRDAVRARIEPRAQNDDLIEPFAQARFEEIFDVPLPGRDESYRPSPRSKDSIVNTGINHQFAQGNLNTAYQRAGNGIVANPLAFRS
jgi:hypothetical protein